MRHSAMMPAHAIEMSHKCDFWRVRNDYQPNGLRYASGWMSSNLKVTEPNSQDSIGSWLGMPFQYERRQW